MDTPSRTIPGSRVRVESRRSLEAQAQSDLLICLVSGGASALLPLPAGDLTLADKQETTRLLLECGANIHEINTIRKHISGIKGGRLAAQAYPATVLSLILSDVIGNDLDVIGSGITAPDRSTFADALALLDRFGLRERVPRSVRRISRRRKRKLRSKTILPSGALRIWWSAATTWRSMPPPRARRNSGTGRWFCRALSREKRATWPASTRRSQRRFVRLAGRCGLPRV